MTVIVIGHRMRGLDGVLMPAGSRKVFDATTDTWTVTSPDGRSASARVLIDTRPSEDATVAVHGMANFFRIPGPDTERQVTYVRRCLDLLERSGATRIEARSRITLRHWYSRSFGHRFYLSGSAPQDHDVYDGPAAVTLPGGTVDVRARLAGHVTAIDGRYHWRGTISGALPDDLLKGQRQLPLLVDGHEVEARVVERTPWGSYTVTGVGAPPFVGAGTFTR